MGLINNISYLNQIKIPENHFYAISIYAKIPPEITRFLYVSGGFFIFYVLEETSQCYADYSPARSCSFRFISVFMSRLYHIIVSRGLRWEFTVSRKAVMMFRVTA